MTISPRPSVRSEAGSAFILALIVIMLLTILGLSLAVVTETEMQLGNTEKAIDRQQFAAESGLWAKVAGLVVTNNWVKESFALVETAPGEEVSGRLLGYAVDSTYAKTIAEHCPSWTDCGEDLEQRDYKASFVLIGSTATRVGYPQAWLHPFKGRDPSNEDSRTIFEDEVIELGRSSVAMGFFASPLKWGGGHPVLIQEGKGSIKDGFRQ